MAHDPLDAIFGVSPEPDDPLDAIFGKRITTAREQSRGLTGGGAREVLGTIASPVTGALRGTARSVAGLAGFADLLAPDNAQNPVTRALDAFAKGVERRAASAEIALNELIPDTPHAQIGAFAGDLGSLLLPIGATGAAIRAAGAAGRAGRLGALGRAGQALTKTDAAGRTGLNLAGRSLVSVPTAAVLGAREESSTVGAVADLFRALDKPEQAERFEALNENPLTRIGAEVALDAVLGFGIEGALAGRQARRTARDVAARGEQQVSRQARLDEVARRQQVRGQEGTGIGRMESIARQELEEEARERTLQQAIAEHLADPSARGTAQARARPKFDRPLGGRPLAQLSRTERRLAVEGEPSRFPPEAEAFQQETLRAQRLAGEQAERRTAAERGRDAVRRALEDLRSQRGAVPVVPGRAAEPERVGRAAVMLTRDLGTLPEGHIEYGTSHTEAAHRIARFLGMPLEQVNRHLVDGFDTNRRPFVNRRLATEIGVESGQISPDRPRGDIGLTSEELAFEEGSRAVAPTAARALTNRGAAAGREFITPVEAKSEALIPALDNGPRRERLRALEERTDLTEAERADVDALRLEIEQVDEQQLEVQELVEQALRSGDGADEVTKALGLDPATVRVSTGRGAFAGNVTPNVNVALRGDLPVETVRQAAAAHAIARGQKAAVWLQVAEEGAEDVAPGHVIRAASGLKIRPSQYQQLHDIINGNARYRALEGSSLIDGRVIFRNFTDLPEEQYAQLVREVADQMDETVEIAVTSFRGEYLDGPEALREALAAGGEGAVGRVADLLATRTGPVFRRLARSFKDTEDAVQERLDAYLAAVRGDQPDQPPRRGVDLRSERGVVPVTQVPKGQVLEAPPAFRRVIERTPGASLTPRGIRLRLERFQRHAQAGAVSTRTGVFYVPEGSPQARFFKGNALAKLYGGPVQVSGETLLQRPFVVASSGGGFGPAEALARLLGERRFTQMQKELGAAMRAVDQFAPRRERRAQGAGALRRLLEKWGTVDEEILGDLIDIHSGPASGNRLPFALQENIVATQLRRAGYDSVVSHRNGRIQEVFDVREAAFPVPGEATTKLVPGLRKRVTAGKVGDPDSPLIRGAVALAQRPGQVDFDGWVRLAEREGLPPDRAVFEQSAKKLKQLVAEAAQELPSLRKMEAALARGRDASAWYGNIREEVAHVIPDPADQTMFLRFYAVTSQRTVAEKDNIQRAADAFIAWKQGKPLGEGHIPAVANNLKRVANGLPANGRKIRNFERAVLGDTDAVVVDVWMARFFLGKDKVNDAQYSFIEQAIRSAARRAGVTPVEYQAALWKVSRGEAKPIGPIIRRALEQRKDLTSLLRNELGFADFDPRSGRQLVDEAQQSSRQRLQELFPVGGVLGPVAGAGVGAAVGGAVGGAATDGEDAGILAGAAAGAALGGGLALGAGRAASRALLRRDAEEAIERGAQQLGRRPRERATRPSPPGQPKTTTRVQAKTFGLSPKTTTKMQDEIDRLAASGQARLKRVSFAEFQRAAQQLGLDDVRQADYRQELDGVTLTAAKNLYLDAETRVQQLLKQQGELAAQFGEGQVANTKDWRRLQAQIETLEEQQQELLGIYTRGASELGRQLNSLKIAAKHSLNPEATPMWVTRAKRLAGRELLPEETLRLQQLIRDRDRAGLLSFMRGLAPPKGLFEVDTWLQIRRAGLLTGIRTQARNFLSNFGEFAMRTLDQPATALADVVVSRFVTGERTVKAISPLERIAASRRGAARGIRNFLPVLRGKEGPTVGELRKLDLRKEMNFKSRIVDGYVKFMFRLQGAADQPWRQAAFMESLVEQAAVLSKTKGDRAALVEQALKSFDDGTPNDMAIQAIIDAEEAVFQNPSAVGNLISGAKARLRVKGAAPGVEGSSFRAAGQLLEFVVPFSNTPGAVIGRLVERTPVGLLSGAAGIIKLARMADGEVSEAVLRDMQRRAVRRLGRGATGTLAMLLGMHLAEKGLMSGRWPDDRKEQDRWRQDGIPEDAIFVNGKWRVLSGVSPLGNLMAVGAQLYLDAKNPEYESAQTIAMQGGLTALRTVKEQSFLRGTKELLDAVDNKYGEGERFAARAAGSFVPILVGDFARAADPIIRDPQTLGQGLQARIPYWTMRVPPRLDEFGREKVGEQTRGEQVQRFVDPFLSKRPRSATDPILRELNTVGATVSRRAQRGDETNAAYRERRRREGAEEREALEVLFGLSQYRRLDDSLKAEVAEALISGVRRAMTDAEKRGRRPPATWRPLIQRTIQRERQR